MDSFLTKKEISERWKCSESAINQMIAEGMERGLAQGMERGLAQGTERGIKNLIEVCQELGGTYDNTQFQVEMRYHLSQEDAGKYMKQYWK